MELQEINKALQENRVVLLSKNSKLKIETIKRLELLLDMAPPREYRDHLIEIYHGYIQARNESFLIDFKQMAENIDFLCDFFKQADEEYK